MFEDQTPLTVGAFAMAMMAITQEIVFALTPAGESPGERLEQIANRLLDLANGVEKSGNAPMARIMHAVAASLVAAEPDG